ncbi:MAG: hypothetical protein ACREI9_04105 [Nitrospiraceae bacterium]
MKITHIETLISVGAFAQSPEWQSIRGAVIDSIRKVGWPPRSDKFTIYPESGKKRRKGNGVTPIKNGLIRSLIKQKWKKEVALDIATVTKPGKLDAVLQTHHGPVALEWETGNISSSHRALNKMALGLMKEALAAGVLVVPSRELYQYLTDRVGNWSELEPYLDLWKAIPCRVGILEIVVVEHDATSTKVPRIPKGTSGRALE